ncbi:MAG TPA: hypothetical protein VFX98_17280 [Longimicrobiaceae bacterium]|nr:hypothetical protein [Longimicrobiaceae bacterium]
MNESENLVHELAAAIPALRGLLEEHLDFYEELLPHVFMGDVSRYAFGEYERLAGGGEASPSLSQLLSLLERAARDGGGHVRDLVGASFLENLAVEFKEHPGFRAMLGPVLKQYLEPLLRGLGHLGEV